jgi:hypothetical protein
MPQIVALVLPKKKRSPDYMTFLFYEKKTERLKKKFKKTGKCEQNKADGTLS